jgi:predicted transposase YdaD
MYSDVVQTPSYRIGLSDGREEGLERGIREGVATGMLREQKRIARQLLDVLSDKLIAKKTGLAIEVVSHIRGIYTEALEVQQVVAPVKEILYG